MNCNSHLFANLSAETRLALTRRQLFARGRNVIGAAALGIKIYTIGAGTNGTAWLPVYASGGRVEYRQSAVTIDEQTLAGIAGLTGGKYFRATDAAALRSIYAEINELEKTRNLVEHHQLRLEAFPWVVGLGLALLVIEIVLVNTRLRTIP